MNELQPNNPEMGVKDFVAVLRRRIWVVLPVLLLCVGGAYALTKGTPWTKGLPETSRAEAQLQIVHRVPTGSGNPLDGVQAQTDETMETQMGLIQTGDMAERTWYALQSPQLVNLQKSLHTVPFRDQNQVYELFSGSVKVTNPTDSSLLNITADVSNPDAPAQAAGQARLLVEAVARAFQARKQDDAQKYLRDAANNLKERYKKAKAKLSNAELAEMQFKQKHHLANVDEEEKKALSELGSSDATVIALQGEVDGLESRARDLDAQLRAADLAVSSADGVPDEALVQRLQSELGRLKSQRAEAASQYTPDFPGSPGLPSLATLDAEIRDTQGQLSRALRATTNHAAPSLMAHGAISAADADAHVQLNLTRAKLAQALQAKQASQEQVEGMPSLQRQYAQLHRDSELTAQIATSLQGALNQTLLETDQASGNVLITQHNQLVPTKPKLNTNLILGLALGALLSLGLVMLLEQLDQRVRTLDEVRALVSGPIIGMLPRTSRGQMKALTQGRLLPQVEEAFSLVQINLSYVMRHSMMRNQTEHQIILVTSAVPREGKSVAAAELARSMAESGKSVILVNANLRQPSQNALFQNGEAGGLTDVLSGQLPLDEAIATSNVQNLSVLNSGLSYENPTVLLSQPRLASVMEELRYKADVVIIDGPDCTLAADILLLTAHADCLMQVVRAGFVDMETLHNAALALHSTGKKVTVLANSLTSQQQHAFKMRFAYAALTSQSETPALPQTFEKTMVMNRSRDLVFSKSVNKPLEIPEGTSEKNDES